MGWASLVSVFDIFKIGIGPSSSHTVGPMVAGARFMTRLERKGAIEDVAQLTCTLYGSLAFTGKGHGTDVAVILGLLGECPSEVDPGAVDRLVEGVRASKHIERPGGHRLNFDPDSDLTMDLVTPSPGHPNALSFSATDASGNLIEERTYFSVGGGFVLSQEDYEGAESAVPDSGGQCVPYPFRRADELLSATSKEKITIAEIVLANERALRPSEEIDSGLDRIWKAMTECIDRGLLGEGRLPGGLNVCRRAKSVYEKAVADCEKNLQYPHRCMDRISAYAMAVNEENAAGGRVVTSPTNGAAGVIPAVLRYYLDLCPGSDRGGVHIFLLTATAFGAIIKYNASLSGAEVGCQGEVGSASAMAAAGLAAALGGNPQQIENAAEIALEHHLGMTCDPVGGLVQVPCIERNAMGAVKAINAASLALAGDGVHIVSFDTVVETMRQTGEDLQTKYKETSRGGLAVTVVEC